MPNPWAEELDHYLVQLAVHTPKLSSYWKNELGSLKPSRAIRMENLRTSLKIIVELYEGKKLNYGYERGAIPELRLAFRQFEHFDYRIISFTYGEMRNVAISLKIDRALEKNLEVYLTKDLTRALDSYFELQKTASDREDFLVRKFYEKFDELWAQALIEGKITP